MYGLIGKKVKMTQIFNDNGHVVPVTLVEAGPCTVSQIKEEKNTLTEKEIYLLQQLAKKK